MKCEWCGGEFTPNGLGGRPRKYCSKQCARRASFKAWYQKNRMSYNAKRSVGNMSRPKQEITFFKLFAELFVRPIVKDELERKLAERDKKFVSALETFNPPSKEFFQELHTTVADSAQVQH